MNKPPAATDRWRLVVLAIATFTLLSLLLLQFFKVQIVEEEKWSARAERQHTFTMTEPFRRGRFFSNTTLRPGHPDQPQPLVIDVQRYHLFADPYSIREELREPIAAQLASLLSVNEQPLLTELEKNRSRSRRLVRWLSHKQRDAIREWWRPFARKHRIARNALYFQKDYQRSYPYGPLAGQVLHTIQEQKNEKTKQALPTGGLEASLNHHLKGTLGKTRMLRSPRNRFATGEVLSEPVDGADVYLTINGTLQAIAEEELAKGVEHAGARGGWAVIMDPYTGDLLALAQYPFFDPAHYRDYFNDPTKIEWTNVRAATDGQEPGSTMKPITVAIALQANATMEAKGKERLFDPEEKMAVANGHFPGRRKPIVDTHPTDYLDLAMGMRYSSNIYMARLVQRIVDQLGDNWYRKILNESFGFGQKSGIELPVETAGLLPRPGKLHPNGKLEWSKPTPFSLAMGYNVQASSLQMVRAWSVLANGGRLVEPTLVRYIERDGEIILDRRNRQGKEVIDPEICAKVRDTLKFVTTGTGSGRRGNLPGYTEVGKTGTTKKLVDGQYSSEKYFASFIGFAPADNPRFVLCVALDEPPPSATGNQYGGKVAAPIFREIALRTLHYLGVDPDDQENQDWAEETKRLQEKYRKWNDPPSSASR